MVYHVQFSSTLFIGEEGIDATMMSSMSASYTTSSVIHSIPEESRNLTKTNQEGNKTIGPITDIAKNSTCTACAEDAQTYPTAAAADYTAKPNVVEKSTKTCSIPSYSNSNIKSNSKIPYPLATLLASKTNQIRRSASLRLRGTKSNLLLNTFPQRNSHNNNTTQIEQVTTHNCASNAMRNEMMDNNQVTHNTPTTGHVSPRRKFVLNSTQQLNAHGSSLTRSLSLKRNPNSKTDFNTEEASCTVAEALKDLTLNDNTSAAPKEQQQSLETDNVGVPEVVNTNDINPIAKKNTANGGITYVDGQREQQILHKEDTSDMVSSRFTSYVTTPS